MATPTSSEVYSIIRAAALEHYSAHVPTGAAVMADRLAAGIANGYARATPQQRTDWTSLGPDTLRAAAVTVAQLGLNPDPGAKEIYIYPRGGQLIVSPTPEAVRTMLRRAGYDLQIFLCGPHDAEGIDVRAGRIESFNPGRQPLDWVATASTCIGARVLVVDLTTGEATLDRWLPTAIIERRRSAGRGGKPWQETWDEMATKTGQLFALKYMPKDRINAAIIESATVEWDTIAEDIAPATARRTVTLPTSAPALPGPAPIPESRQLAAPAPDADWSPAPDLVPVQQTPAPIPATRAAPEWAGALKAELKALVAATGAKSSSAALAAVGIAVSEAPDIEALRAEIIEATVTAQEREAPAAR